MNVPDDLVVRCHDCGGTQIWKREGNEIQVYHDCFNGKHSRESFAALEAERDAALTANELDRRNLNAIVRSVDAEITGRMWLIEGRGSYEWDDDRYKHEFGWAIHAIQEKLYALRKIAGDLSNSPTNESGVERVRKLEKLEAENAELKNRFGRGPHLLTARDGSQALCGGPGVCPACIHSDENAALRKQIERMSAPVTDAEWIEHREIPTRDNPAGTMYRSEISELIAARKGTA